MERLARARRPRRLTPPPRPSPGVFGSGLWLDLSREQRASGVQLVGLFNSLADFGVALCAQLTPYVLQTLFSSQRSATARAAHGQAFERVVEDGAGKSGARLRLDAALEAAEDGHVVGLQERRASWREECEYDVWESARSGGQGGASLACRG